MTLDLTDQEREIFAVISTTFHGSIWTRPNGDANDRGIYGVCVSLAAKGLLREHNRFGSVVIWTTAGAQPLIGFGQETSH